MFVARVSDPHSCPVETNSCPHVGGPILRGSTDVLLGGQPIARLGDPAKCEGPTSVIVEGSATVLVNSIPVAAQGHATADGGTIVGGMATVLVGAATVKLEWYPADADGLFTPENMWRILRTEHRGADSETLRTAMHTLASDPTGAELDAALQQIADARGLPLDQVSADYDRFQVIRGQNRLIGDSNDAGPIEALSDDHASFMASPEQLAYGQVVGEAYGVDPVFGALLNPTGGLVGPANRFWDGRWIDIDSIHVSRWRPIGAHGIFHDAAGFLYNYAHAGPGYTYTPRARGNPGNPLRGQVDGLNFWAWEFRSAEYRYYKDQVVEAAGEWLDGVRDRIVEPFVQFEREIYRLYKVPYLP